jgi:hypothetical protein
MDIVRGLYIYPSLTRVYWQRELSGEGKIMVDVG